MGPARLGLFGSSILALWGWVWEAVMGPQWVRLVGCLGYVSEGLPKASEGIAESAR